MRIATALSSRTTLAWACTAAIAVCAGAGVAVAASQGGPAVSPRLVYRARADIEGDARLDAIVLTPASSGGRLEATLSSGRTLVVDTSSDAPFLPGLVAVGNVNGYPGAELFVDEQHITTEETVAIYTYARGTLRRAGTLPAYGSDFGIRFGLTCASRGRRHYIYDDLYELRGSAHQRWVRQETVYVWHGSTLKRLGGSPARSISGPPAPAKVGVRCGRPA
jgi:hypothetical protein